MSEKVLGVLGEDPQAAFFVPGRIEVLGKHTDYAGGRSLVTALERGFHVAAAGRPDRVVRVRDAARGVEDSFEWPGVEERPGDWSNYPRTVARRMGRDFPGKLRGAEVVFAGNLPAESGLSSSSALVVAVFLAISSINDLQEHPVYRAHLGSLEKLAEYLACVENGYPFGPLEGGRGVGTLGGSQDHTAILCCHAGKLSQYAFRPVRFEREMAMPPAHVFAVAVSGVRAPKTGSALQHYNRLSELSRRLVEIWQETGGGSEPHLGAVLESSSQAADRLRRAVQGATADSKEAQALLDRLEQFEAETRQIIPAVPDRWNARSLLELGRLVDRSALVGARLLANQTPETLHLREAARRLGATAASPFGAGFGGSVWALVETGRSRSFLEAWREDYSKDFPALSVDSDFFLSRAGPAATKL